MGVRGSVFFFLLFFATQYVFAEDFLPEEQQASGRKKHNVLDALGGNSNRGAERKEAQEAQIDNDRFKGLEDQLATFKEKMNAFKEKYDFPLFEDDPKVDPKEKIPTPENPMPSEMNYPQILGSPAENEFHDKSAIGNKNKAGKIPQECENFAAQNPDGITFVQPSSVNDLGAVLFGGQACSGVKRREGKQNNWPSAAADGLARMTPDGINGKSSNNYAKGSYGPQGEGLEPIWLGDSGAVQIHSLRTLQGDASLAGVSSMGCLVVNQDCMKALNQFLAKRSDLKFKIITSDGAQSIPSANDACTRAVNKPQI